LEYNSYLFLAFFFSPSASLHLFDSFASKSGARQEKPFAHNTRGWVKGREAARGRPSQMQKKKAACYRFSIFLAGSRLLAF